jgi:hypothetical protein
VALAFWEVPDVTCISSEDLIFAFVVDRRYLEAQLEICAEEKEKTY